MATETANLFSLHAFLRLIPAVRNAGRSGCGANGEGAVVELLDRLRARGYRVFHDVPVECGNIDHVVMCDRGVFTIAAKWCRKPDTGAAIVRYDGATLSLNGSKPCEKPLVQARQHAGFLKRYLKARTGRSYPVRPVVLYPGWSVKRTRRHAPTDVWVPEPGALQHWIERQPEAVDLADLKMAANTLSRYIRKFE